MVGAINPPTTGNTFQKFQTNAEAFKGDVSVCPFPHLDLRNDADKTILQQLDSGALSGPGASASVGVGNVPTAVTLFGAQASSTSPAGNTTGTGNNTGSNPSQPGSVPAQGPAWFLLVVALISGVMFI